MRGKAPAEPRDEFGGHVGTGYRIPLAATRIAFRMRNHSKDKDEQPIRRPRIPALPKPYVEKDPFQALFAYAYLQAQEQRKQAVEELRLDAEAISEVIATQHTVAVSGFDLQGKLDYLIEQALTITNAGGAVVALAEGDQIICRARAGLIGPPLGAGLDPNSGISGECIRSGELLYCDDTETDPRVNLAACRQLGIRSILAIPLILHEQTLGVVEIFSGWAGVFGDRESRTLKLIAGQILEALWQEETPKPRAAAATAEEITEEPHTSPGAAEASLVTSAVPAVAAPVPPVALTSASIFEPAESMSAAEPTTIEFDFLKGEEKTKVFTPKVIIAVIVVAALLALLVWEYWTPHPVPPPKESENSSAQPVTESATSGPQPTVVPSASGQAHLTEIRHWSKHDYTSIAVFLDGAAKYQAAALHDPERIYFDLQETSLAENFPKKKELVVDVDDQLVERVRAAQKDGSVTRVVLDLKSPAEYNTVLSSDSPYRLMIAVHPRGTKPVALTDLPGPVPAGPSSADTNPPDATKPPVMTAAPEMSSVGTRSTVPGKSRLRIVIDPGHGGSEDGAIGRDGLKEKDLVLDVAHRLGTLLAMKLDAEIFYTRTDDHNVGLEQRTEYANQLQADIFVSVHANSSLDPNARGIETYYMDSASSMHEAEVAARENANSQEKVGRVLPMHLAMRDKIERSRKLATMVQQALYDSLADGQLRNRGVKKAPFVVLLGADMPAVLAEVSFLSSPDDERVLANPELRDRVADALYHGIAKYLASSKQERAYLHSASLAGK